MKKLINSYLIIHPLTSATGTFYIPESFTCDFCKVSFSAYSLHTTSSTAAQYVLHAHQLYRYAISTAAITKEISNTTNNITYIPVKQLQQGNLQYYFTDNDLTTMSTINSDVVLNIKLEFYKYE